jgi:tetrahydrodipicolinate N-succinyltransferase
MSGITVGDGAILAANSHVIKDVQPYEIVGGNPAQHIKYRFSNEIIEFLTSISWWYLDDAIIKKIHPLLTAEPTKEIIEKIKKILKEK